MEKDYEKGIQEFMEMSTRKIQELLAKQSTEISEEKKQEINHTIDLIKKEMQNYTLAKKSGKHSAGKEVREKKELAPPRKEKIVSPAHAGPRKFEVCLEGIAEDLQNYGALIARLKVRETTIER